jgi:hypothetical protein
MDGAVGPVGPAGPPGADGADGVDGIDGSSIITLAEVLNNGNTTTEGTFSGDIIISTGDSILSAAELTITAATSFDILGSIGSTVVVSGATEDLTLGARGAMITLNEAGQESLSTTDFGATSIIGALNELASISMAGVGTLAATLSAGNITSGSDMVFTAGDEIIFQDHVLNGITGQNNPTGTGARLNLSGGFGSAGGQGGAVNIYGGSSLAGGNGGWVQIFAGNVQNAFTGDGGKVWVRAGNGGTGGGDGGDVDIIAGKRVGGLGSGGSINFQTSATFGVQTTRWLIDENGDFLPFSTNQFEIGALAGNRPSNIYAATSLRAGSLILNQTTIDTSSGLTIGGTSATSLTLGRLGLTTMIGGALGHAGTNSDTWSIQTAETEVTGLSGGAQTAVGIIPAKALVLGDVGDGVDIDHWGSGIILDSDPGDFTDNTLAWNNGPAADVVLTANGGVFTAGAVRIVVTYVNLTAPTS